jgi:hypothetical protein
MFMQLLPSIIPTKLLTALLGMAKDLWVII